MLPLEKFRTFSFLPFITSLDYNFWSLVIHRVNTPIFPKLFQFAGKVG